MSASPPDSSQDHLEWAERERIAQFTPYWTALGRLTEELSNVEHALFGTMVYLVEVPDDIGKAIFSGTRSDLAISYITRILEVRDIHDIRAEIHKIFCQLRIIYSARNIIVHHGWSVSREHNTEFYFATFKEAHIEDKLRELTLTVDDINAMAVDARTACAKLICIWKLLGKSHDFPILPTAIAQRPWLYKPPQQAGARKRPRGKNPGREAQPESSPSSRQRQKLSSVQKRALRERGKTS